MTRSKRWVNLLLLSTVVFSSTALALTPEEEERLRECRRPKFRDFVPEQKAEVDPGSAMSFHVSRNADPLSITAEARGEKLKVEVVDKKTFYFAKATLPKLAPGFARIHVMAKSAESKVESGCWGQDGWLIKIKGDAPTGAAEPAKTAPAPQSAPATAN